MKTIEQMSLEEKIGQLFVITSPHRYPDGETIHLLTAFHASGIHIQEENVERFQQLSNFIARLQMYADKQLPLFIISDRYGGAYPTLAKKLTKTFTEKQLGTINNRLYTKQYAEYNAKLLHELGFNTMRRPPVYVDAVEDDSFGADPRRVAQHSVATIDGHRNAGTLSIAKIGKKQVETIFDANWERKPWIHNSSLLYPLYKAITNDVECLHVPMQTFAIDRDIDSDNAVTHIIEEKLQFSNVFTTSVSLAEANVEEQIETIVRALNHSVHLIMLDGSYNAQFRVIETIRQAVVDGEIEEKTIDIAVEKVLRIKKSLHVKQLARLDHSQLQTRLANNLTNKLQSLLE